MFVGGCDTCYVYILKFVRWQYTVLEADAVVYTEE